MSSPATAIAGFLAAEGLGTIGTDMVIGGLPERIDACMAIGDAPAHASAHPNVDEDNPTVKILVRDPDYDAGYTKAESIKALLQALTAQDIAGRRVISCLIVGDINWLGRDDNNRGQWSLNFNLIRARFDTSSVIYSTDWSDLDGWTVVQGSVSVADGEATGDGAIIRPITLPASFSIRGKVGDVSSSGASVFVGDMALQDGVELQIRDTFVAINGFGGTPEHDRWESTVSPDSEFVITVTPDAVRASIAGVDRLEWLTDTSQLPLSSLAVMVTPGLTIGTHPENNLFEVIT